MANPEPLEQDDEVLEEETEESSQESNVITFDRGQSLHQQFAQYLNDPDVVAAASTVFGKKTRERMAQLEHELAEERRRNESAGLGEIRAAIEEAREDPEKQSELLQKVASDPDFNKRYWAAMQNQPQQGGYSKDQVEARQAINSAYEDLLVAGAPQQWVQQAVQAYEGAIQQGQLGQTPTSIAVNVQRRIGEVIRKRAWEPKAEPKADPEPEAEKEEVVEENPNFGRSQKQRVTIGPENPRLAERADTSPSRGGGGSPRKSQRPQYATRQQAARLFSEGKISADEYKRAKSLPFE